MTYYKDFLLRWLLFAYLCVLTLVLSSCGFHMRQFQDLPPQLKMIQVVSADTNSSLKDIVIQNFQAMGINVCSSAPLTLAILNENFSDTKSIIGTAQQLNSVTLSYTVTVMLKDNSGTALTEPATFTTSTAYLQNANQILGDINTTTSLKQELMRNMSQIILSYLSAEDTKHAISFRH